MSWLGYNVIGRFRCDGCKQVINVPLAKSETRVKAETDLEEEGWRITRGLPKVKHWCPGCRVRQSSVMTREEAEAILVEIGLKAEGKDEVQEGRRFTLGKPGKG
jgi:hypothetical protein